MNRIEKLFETKKENILNIYFTAGYPAINDTRKVIRKLDELGVDLIELGIPYSDPLADGPTIQESGTQAIENGMTLEKLFEQLESLRTETQIPIILMGYLNQIMQFGIDRFFEKCTQVGIDGLIFPDLPVHVFENQFATKIKAAGLTFSFLITPQTGIERRKKIDELSSGFVYVVSSSSITGGKAGFSQAQIDYLEVVKATDWKNPTLVGFGISNADSYQTVCKYANGAIIGSAFIKTLAKPGDLDQNIEDFIKSIR